MKKRNIGWRFRQIPKLAGEPLPSSIKDIENYPGKAAKSITLDLQKIVPIDTEGDEVYVLTSTSTATKIGGGTASPLYIREFKSGYARSSGRVNSPFNLTSTNNKLQISIDNSVTFREITLNVGNGLSGEVIADDIQTKINALSAVAQPEAGNLSYLNTTVEFKNNKFLIVAGSVSNTYVGTGKSSVKVAAGTTNDASVTLGFNMYVDSESLSSKRAVETILTATYSGGLGIQTIGIESITDLSTSGGEAFTITNGINREYLVSSGVSVGLLTMVGPGLLNTYSGGSILQKIFERDSSGELASPVATVDDITRFSLRSIANQLDFSI